ncbi:putative ankyrin repeat-containing domain-containing protein [Helianthus debilis subsp. tardiflorus]
MSGSEGSSGHSAGDPPPPAAVKKKDKAKVSRTSLILWHAHQNDPAAVRKLLEEDRSLVQARDYDNRTPLHVASLHGWIEVAKCLIEYGADVNAQDRWKNTLKFVEELRFYLHLDDYKLVVEIVGNLLNN